MYIKTVLFVALSCSIFSSDTLHAMGEKEQDVVFITNDNDRTIVEINKAKCFGISHERLNAASSQETDIVIQLPEISKGELHVALMEVSLDYYHPGKSSAEIAKMSLDERKIIASQKTRAADPHFAKATNFPGLSYEKPERRSRFLRIAEYLKYPEMIAACTDSVSNQYPNITEPIQSSHQTNTLLKPVNSSSQLNRASILSSEKLDEIIMKLKSVENTIPDSFKLFEAIKNIDKAIPWTIENYHPGKSIADIAKMSLLERAYAAQRKETAAHDDSSKLKSYPSRLSAPPILSDAALTAVTKMLTIANDLQCPEIAESCAAEISRRFLHSAQQVLDTNDFQTLEGINKIPFSDAEKAMLHKYITSWIVRWEVPVDLGLFLNLYISSDGSSAVYAQRKNVLKIDLKTGERTILYNGEHILKTAYSASHDKAIIVSTRDSAILDCKKGTTIPLALPISGFINKIIFSPQADTALCICNDTNIVTINVADDTQTANHFSRNATMRDASFSPHGDLIVIQYEDNTIDILNTKTLKSVYHSRSSNESKAEFAKRVFNPDQTLFIVPIDKKVLVKESKNIENSECAPYWEIPHEKEVYLTQFSPDGSRIISLSGEGTVTIINTALKTTITTLEYNAKIERLDFSPNSETIVIFFEDKDNEPKIINIISGKELCSLVDLDADHASFSANGALIATPNNFWRNGPSIWDTKSGQRLYTIKHGSYSHPGSFSPDNSLYIAPSEDAVLRIAQQLPAHTFHQKILIRLLDHARANNKLETALAADWVKKALRTYTSSPEAHLIADALNLCPASHHV